MSSDETLLREGSLDICYEVEAVLSLASLLHRWPTQGQLAYGSSPLGAGADRVVMARALLEAWLVHVRCLYEFLFGRRKRRCPREDQLFAEAFVGSEWETEVPVPGYLSANEKGLEKALSHIATDRAKYVPPNGWQVTAITTELYGALAEFRRRLPESRGGWFSSIPDSLTLPSPRSSKAIIATTHSDPVVSYVRGL